MRPSATSDVDPDDQARRAEGRRQLIILALYGIATATLWALITLVHTIDWRQAVTHAPVVADTPDRLTFVVIAAATLIICAIAVHTNPPARPPSTRRRWLARAGVVVGILSAIIAVIVTVIPARPVSAAPKAFDARTATSAALATLMSSYRTDLGLWDVSEDKPGWWQSAIDLDTVIHAEQALGTHRYDGAVEHTYTTDLTYHGYIVQYRGDYFDDAGWWGVTWLDGYDYLHDPRMLATAETVDAYLAGGWTSTCGGGVAWAVPAVHGGDQKNAITNELYAVVSARLYTETRKTVYLQRALAAWRWLRSSGLVRPGQLVVDHLDTACRPAGARFTYTQGEAIAAGQALTAATGNPGYLATARSIADRAVTSPVLHRGGVLHEPCEPANCGTNGASFKAPYMAALVALGGHQPYLTRQATAVYQHDRMTGARYGELWAGPLTASTANQQASAIAALASAIPDTQ